MADRTADPETEWPKSMALEQAFPWDEVMDPIDSLPALAKRLAGSQAQRRQLAAALAAIPAGQQQTFVDGADTLLSAIAETCKRPVVLVQAHDYGVDDGRLYPYQRCDAAQFGRGTNYTWDWLGCRVPGKPTKQLGGAMDDDATVAALQELGVLDKDLFADEQLVVLGRTGEWQGRCC